MSLISLVLSVALGGQPLLASRSSSASGSIKSARDGFLPLEVNPVVLHNRIVPAPTFMAHQLVVLRVTACIVHWVFSRALVYYPVSETLRPTVSSRAKHTCPTQKSCPRNTFMSRTCTAGKPAVRVRTTRFDCEEDRSWAVGPTYRSTYGGAAPALFQLARDNKRLLIL